MARTIDDMDNSAPGFRDTLQTGSTEMSETDFLPTQLMDAPSGFLPSDYPYLHDFYLSNRKGKQREVSPSLSASTSSYTSAALREQKTIELFLELWSNKVGKKEEEEEGFTSSTSESAERDKDSSSGPSGGRSGRKLEEPDATVSRLEDKPTFPFLLPIPSPPVVNNLGTQDTARAAGGPDALQHPVPMGLPALSTPPTAKRGIQIKGRSKLVSKSHAYPAASSWTVPTAKVEDTRLPVSGQQEYGEYRVSQLEAVHVSLPERDDHFPTASPPDTHPSWENTGLPTLYKHDVESCVSATEPLRVPPPARNSVPSPQSYCTNSTPTLSKPTALSKTSPMKQNQLSTATPDSPTSTHSNSSTDFGNPNADTFLDAEDDEMARLPTFTPMMKASVSPSASSGVPKALQPTEERKKENEPSKSSFTLDASFAERTLLKKEELPIQEGLTHGTTEKKEAEGWRERKQEGEVPIASSPSRYQSMERTPIKLDTAAKNGGWKQSILHESQTETSREDATPSHSATKETAKPEEPLSNEVGATNSFRASDLHDANIQAIQRALDLLGSSPSPELAIANDKLSLTPTATASPEESYQSKKVDQELGHSERSSSSSMPSQNLERTLEPILTPNKATADSYPAPQLDPDYNPHQTHSIHVPSLVHPQPRRWRTFQTAQTLEDSVSSTKIPENKHGRAMLDAEELEPPPPEVDQEFEMEFQELPPDIAARLPKEGNEEKLETTDSVEEDKPAVKALARTLEEISIRNRPPSPEPVQEEKEQVSISSPAVAGRSEAKPSSPLDPRRYATIESPSPPPDLDAHIASKARSRSSSSASSSSSSPARSRSRTKNTSAAILYMKVLPPPIRWNGSLAKKGRGNQSQRFGTVMSTQSGVMGPKRTWRSFNYGGGCGSEERQEEMSEQRTNGFEEGMSNTERVWRETRDRRGIPHPDSQRHQQTQEEEDDVLGMATFSRDYKVPVVGGPSFNRDSGSYESSSRIMGNKQQQATTERPAALTDEEIDFFDQIMAETGESKPSNGLQDSLDDFDRMLNGD